MDKLSTITFNDDQVKLIKSQIAPKATDAELQLFLYHAKRTGLDPLARQIYMIHRNVKTVNGWTQKGTIQVSIDGLRAIAERSGDYAGQDEPIFEEGSQNPIKAKVTVYRFRGDVRYPAAVGIAYWSEYYPGKGQGMMWDRMGHTMLAKVAEALALRKAYPQDLSGLYTTEEMEQANEVNPVIAPKLKSGLTDEEMAKIKAAGNPADLAEVCRTIKSGKTGSALTELVEAYQVRIKELGGEL